MNSTITKSPSAKFAVIEMTTDRCQQNYSPQGSVISRHRTFAAAEKEMLRRLEGADILDYTIGEYNPADSDRKDGYVVMGASNW